MIPKSFSATALNVFELCPARYKAEHIEYTKGFGSSAANLGTAVHGALELYVKQVYINKSAEPKFDLLIDMLRLSYTQTFGSSDYNTVLYMEAYGLLDTWYKRTDLSQVQQVISCETKSHFDVPTSAGPIPYNYIWDRFDQIEDGVFKVVDYKSNKWNITVDDLKKKIQARSYGLAAAIQLKAQKIPYKRIWVEFDMLRHVSVGISFNHEDNVLTWNYLLNSAEEIIKRGEDEFEEKLNNECLFCVRKAQCGALKKNLLVGGIHTISSVEEAVDVRAQVEWQKKGLESLIKDLDTKILAEAKERDMLEFESDNNRLKIGVSSQRAVDAERVKHVIGPDIFERYGDEKITMASVEKLLKGKELTDEQKAQLRSLIYYKQGEPRVKTEPKNPVDPD